MAKFFGPVGFVLPAVETKADVWTEPVVEHNYYGDIKPTRQLEGAEKVNQDISVNNTLSILAHGFASENFFAIRYVKWMGALWTVTNVEVQSPRLLLRLGGLYNGPKV